MVYSVIGGDLRQFYLCEMLQNGKNTVNTFSVFGKSDTHRIPHDAIKTADAIILPVLMTRDSVNINAPLSAENIPIKSIIDCAPASAAIFGGHSGGFERIINYNGSEVFLTVNAMLTAEAAVALVIENTECSLPKSNILITGFGRISKFLCRYLHTLGCNVNVCVRKHRDITLAKLNGYNALRFTGLNNLGGYDCVVNTVPAPVLDNALLATATNENPIIDLAPSASRIDNAFCKANKINLINAGGLPAKYSPKSAAEIMYDFITLTEKEDKI